jgi:ferredoxin
LTTWNRLPPPELERHDPDIDWSERPGGEQALLRGTERIALKLEGLVSRLVGHPLANLFYHTDTIAFYLLIVVAVTGVYLVVFYQFGYDASYESVAKMNRFPLSALMRAIHRYASGGLMIFTLLHALRIFFQARFQGARRPAWIWGVVMTVALWLAGISGYLLLWDTRAQLIVQAQVNLLEGIPSLAAALHSGLLNAAATEMSWLFMLIFLGLHIGLSALGGLFFWYHIQRLGRPRFFPTRYWMIGTGVILGVLALLFPVGMLPMADLARLPATVPLDAVFLFYFPAALNGPVTGLVVGLSALTAILILVPWIIRRRQQAHIVVDGELCIGCKLCAQDCPYGALTMRARDDGSPYQQIAVVDPGRCVGCGICVGSCNTLALSLGDRPARLIWDDVAARLTPLSASSETDDLPIKVVFACERHIAHGARPYLRPAPAGPAPADPAPVVDGTRIEVVPLTCAAMAHPGLLTRTLEAGAAEVQVVGCPPNDCANREGNLWLEERLRRERAPKLKQASIRAPIFTTWLPPDQFDRALPLHAPDIPDTTEERGVDDERSTWERVFPTMTGRNMAVGLALAAILLLVAVGIAGIPYTPYAEGKAIIQVSVRHASGHNLELEVDSQPVWRGDGRASVFEQIRIPPGERHVRLSVDDGAQVLFDERASLESRQLLVLSFAFDG